MAVQEWMFKNGIKEVTFARMTENKDKHVIGCYPFVSRGKGCVSFFKDPHGVGEDWVEYDLDDMRWHSHKQRIMSAPEWKQEY